MFSWIDCELAVYIVMVFEKHSYSKIFVEVERMNANAHYYKMLKLQFLIVLGGVAIFLQNIILRNIFHIFF